MTQLAYPCTRISLSPACAIARSVQEAAHRRLDASGYLELRRVACEFQSGALTLRGCVPTYYLRQVAFALLVGLDCVDELVDRVEVVAGDNRDRWVRPQEPR